MASGIPKEYYKYGLLAGLGIGALLEYENLDIAYHTVGREVRSLISYAKILRLYAKIKRQNLTVPYFFYETVKRYGDKVGGIVLDRFFGFGKLHYIMGWMQNKQVNFSIFTKFYVLYFEKSSQMSQIWRKTENI